MAKINVQIKTKNNQAEDYIQTTCISSDHGKTPVKFQKNW